MQESDALPNVNPKGFFALSGRPTQQMPPLGGLTGPGQGYAMARSPTGLRCLFQLEVQAPAPTHEEALQAVVAAQ